MGIGGERGWGWGGWKERRDLTNAKEKFTRKEKKDRKREREREIRRRKG